MNISDFGAFHELIMPLPYTGRRAYSLTVPQNARMCVAKGLSYASISVIYPHAGEPCTVL